MKTRALALPALLLAAASASATELLYSTGWNNYTTVESQLCGSPALANEAADDFDLVASIERVYVTGYNSCLAVCFPPPLGGAWVRFYEWTATGPGALLVEHFVPAGGPDLQYDPTDIQDVDVTLPVPFQAEGPTYVSVQLEFASCFYWAYWIANKDTPMGGPAYRRSNGGAWTQVTAFDMQSSDLSFALFGTLGPPPEPQGCGLWAVEPTPDPPGSNQNWLHDLAYLAPDDIWAVGRSYGQYTASDWNQETLALHFDGDDWSIVPTPSPNPVPELTWCALEAVAALAPDDVWAAGTRLGQDEGAGYVGTHNLVLHWDGVSWETMDAPIPASFGLQGVSGDGIYEILALAPDDVWFLGEWIRMNAQGFVFRHALAMHWDGSGFTVHEDFPIVGSNGGTIYAADASSPADVWAVGAAGDGDPAPSSQTFIFHWDGSSWSHVPAGTMPGIWHTLGDVKVLAPDDVWVSGSSWEPPNQVVQFMLHWDGSGWEFLEVPFAGGTIVGAPPEMYVFGSGGVSVFDGASFTDAHLLEGLESLAAFGFGEVVQTGPCEMVAAGFQRIAGDAHTLVARLLPLAWSDLGGGTSSSNGPVRLHMGGTLVPASMLSLDLTGAPPSSLAILFIAFSSTPAPFLGGTLHAFPIGELLVLGTDPSGELHGATLFPGAASGQELLFQVGVADASVPIYGASLSNGVLGTVP